MALDPKDRPHVDALVAESKGLLSAGIGGCDQIANPGQHAECIRWLAQAAQFAHLCPWRGNTYRQNNKGVPLEQIINGLKATPSGSPTIGVGASKRAKATAGVRTSSTHAQWQEFDKEDVEAAIKFTREFIEAHSA